MDKIFSKIKYLVLGIIVFIALVYLPTIFDYSNRKADIEATLSKITGNEVKINGSVHIRTLPKAKLILDQVSMTDEDDVTFDIGVLEFNTSFSTLFGGELKVDKVKIREGRFFYNDVKEMVLKNLSGKGTVNLPEFEVDKITLLFDSKAFSSFDEIDHISGTLGYTGITGNNLNLDLKYKIENQPYQFNADLSGFDSQGSSDEAVFNISSSDYEVRFFGKIAEFFSKPKFNGDISLNFLPLDSISRPTNSLYKMLRDDGYVVKASVDLNEQLISAKNIEVNSESIADAKGEIDYSFGEAPNVDIKFTVGDFSIDSFIKIKDVEVVANKSFTHLMDAFFTPLLIQFNLDFDNKTTGSVELDFNKLTYNKNSIDKATLSAVFEKGSLLINDFSANLPGEGVFEITGSVSHNGIRPKLLGAVDFSVKKFAEFSKWLTLDVAQTLLKEDVSLRVQSDISLIPRSMKFEKIKASLGGTKVIGRLGVRKNSDEPININSNFRLNEFNLDDFKIPQSIDDFITALYFYDADKYGRLLTSYVDDYKWLRTYPLESYFDIILDKVTYKEKIFKNIHFSSRLLPNNFEIDQIKISNEDVDLDGRIKVSMTALKPKIDVNLKSKRLNIAKLKTIVPSFDQLHVKYLNALANNKEIEESAQEALKADEDVLDSSEVNNGKVVEKEPNLNASYPKVFNFLSLHNFNSIFDIQFDEIKDDKNPVKSFSIKGSIIEGIFKLQDLQSKMFNGLLKANGSVVILTQVPSMSLSFALNNFNPSELLKYMYGYENFKGYMSVSGTVTGNGLNIENFKNRMYGRLKVQGKKIEVKGFDLGEIIKTTELPMTYNAKLERLKYYSQYGETSFNDVKGRVDFVNGLAAFEDFEFENNRAKGIYVGRVNYLSNITNSVARISFIPTGFNTVLTVNMTSKGQLANQTFEIDLKEISKFLQTRSGDYQKFLQEEEERKSRSLIRNRRL